MTAPQEESLVDRLRRYPVDRYPVQHATTQFHLGSALLQAGDTEPALEALTVARRVFFDAGMALEAAKATIMSGVGLREAGRLEQAAQAFRWAEDALAALDQPAERGAAAYNLGLVLQDRADFDGAHAAWTRAREIFLAGGHPAQAGAAARDHGASLLARKDVEAARPLLEQAAALAERAADDVGTAAAANVLGLAHLAAGDATTAVAVLRRGLGFVPRAVRSADHAMIKANLALAYEQSGHAARARLTAQQAGAVADAAPPVRSQAQEILTRLDGPRPEDLFAVLDEEERDNWTGVIRDELVRTTELSGGERHTWFRHFLDGVLQRDEASYALAQSLLAVVLEMPPQPYQMLIESLVEAGAGRSEDETTGLQGIFGSAMARFAMPQWQRLAASLNAAAEARGQSANWR